MITPPSETVPGASHIVMCIRIWYQVWHWTFLLPLHTVPMHCLSHLLLWQIPSSDKPLIILQPNKFKNNDVLFTIICAVLISQVVMAMSLVSMLKYQQEALLFMSVI